MRGFSLYSAVLALTASSVATGATSAAEPVVLEPIGPWNLNYAEKKCRLTRLFGSDEQRHLLFFEQGAPGSSRMLVLGGPQVRRFKGSRKVKLQFGIDGPIWDEPPYAGNLDDVGPALIYSGVSFSGGPEQTSGEQSTFTTLPQNGEGVEEGAGVAHIRIRRGSRMIDFATGDMAEPIAALSHCGFDLLKHWGLDPEKHKTASRLPEWKNAEQIARAIQKSYPNQALRRGEQGIVRLRVILDEAGAVTECELENATEANSLDSPACREMRRAKFEPALDKDGQPMRSYYTTSIIYRIG